MVAPLAFWLSALFGPALLGVAGGSAWRSAACGVPFAAVAVAQPQDLAALEPRLGSSDADVRRRATAELPRVGSPEALERLLGLLSDPEGMVADEAQLALGAWPEAAHAARIVAALDGRRGDAPLRVAEALGRLTFPVDADALAPALRARDGALRSMLCFSIERLASAGRVVGDAGARLVPALEPLLGERDARLAADALLALAAVVPNRAGARVGRFAADGRPELRAAVAIAAASLGDAAGFELAAPLAADALAAVRVRAAQTLARLGHRDALLLLVERLELEADPRVQRELVGLLRELSGLRHGRDARPWRAWAAALPDPWRAGERRVRSKDSLGEATAAFAGLAIQSERVAFLIDLSGSMWDPREGGRTRKQAVDGELQQALRALPATTQFNVIPFTAEPLPWRKALVPATERNVRDALKAFEGQRARGQGDYFGACLAALEDPLVDTLIVFGDGRPSGGRRWNLELMRVLFEHHTRYRAVVLDAVLVDLSRPIERRWVALCESTGGTCLEVQL